jgi:hypothetical protein
MTRNVRTRVARTSRRRPSLAPGKWWALVHSPEDLPVLFTSRKQARQNRELTERIVPVTVRQATPSGVKLRTFRGRVVSAVAHNATVKLTQVAPSEWCLVIETEQERLCLGVAASRAHVSTSVGWREPVAEPPSFPPSR